MTYAFGKTSLSRMRHVDPKLRTVATDALARCAVDFGCTEEQSRTVAEQQKKFDTGVSKVRPGPGARHMIQPDGWSKALDLVPWINGAFTWGDKNWRVGDVYPFHEIAVAMRLVAIEHVVPIRWGGVWDRRLNDLPPTVDGMRREVEAYKLRHAGPDFLDGPHYELI